MEKTSNQIVFFGSGPVAAKSLELINQNFLVEAVITKPKAEGHGSSAPVLELSEKLGLKTLLAKTRPELDELMRSETFVSKVAILVDYGIIVSEEVISSFPLGIVNSHFSLLPEWRGADPITFSILSGQPFTGVSLMLISPGMDEGPLLAQEKLKIGPETNNISLTEELIKLSNSMLVENIGRYAEGDIKPFPQPDTEPTYSRKIKKEDGLIDWQKDAVQIEREIRAFIGWPKSRTSLKSLEVIITRAHVTKLSGKIGDLTVDGNSLTVCCGKDSLTIDSLKPAGKTEMTIQAFLAGYRSVIS